MQPRAQSTLYIQTCIFSSDEVGRDILKRLTDKAEQGVKVRLLVDGLGSIKTRRSFFGPLVRAGGQFAGFAGEIAEGFVRTVAPLF